MRWGITTRNNEPMLREDRFEKQLSQLFDDFFEMKPSSLFETRWMPSIDVDEDENGIHVKAEIPGIEEKDLHVVIEQNMLTISGEKSEEKKSENKRYVVSERQFGSFYRSIALPEGIDANKITAKFKNGVLHIEIPRTEEAKPKKITIDVH